MSSERQAQPGDPVGVFDSGVGGLSVLRAIRQLLPAESLIYVADQAHVPYGPRPLEEVRAFTEGITGFLLGQGILTGYYVALGNTTVFPSIADLFFVAGSLALAAALTGFLVAYRRARALELTFSRTIRVNTDGEVLERQRCVYTVLPKALTVMAPA